MRGEPFTILLVEDEPAHAEIVRRNLQTARVANRLIWVEDGQAAVDYLRRQGNYSDPIVAPVPSLILLDLRLPKIEGIEVLAIIKADPILKLIPVVIMTTSSAEVDIALAYGNHANSYVVKLLALAAFSTLLDVLGMYWLVRNERSYAESA